MTRIVRVGNSHGVTLDRETLARASLRLGDELVVTPVQDGVLLTARASGQGRMLAAAMADLDDRPDLYRLLAQ